MMKIGEVVRYKGHRIERRLNGYQVLSLLHPALCATGEEAAAHVDSVVVEQEPSITARQALLRHRSQCD